MRQGDFKPAQVIGGWSTLATGQTLSAVAGVVGFCLLVSLGAQVRIPVPWSDVPMTLQALAVLLTGFMLPPRRAVAATVLYLLCGVAGLPVFAAGSAGLAGPTGGYLVGFVVAAWLVSVLKGDGRGTLGRLVAAGAVGTLAIFALGTTWRLILAGLCGWFSGDVALAVTTGLMPFLAKAVVELFIAVMLVVSVSGLRYNRRRRGAL